MVMMSRFCAWALCLVFDGLADGWVGGVVPGHRLSAQETIPARCDVCCSDHIDSGDCPANRRFIVIASQSSVDDVHDGYSSCCNLLQIRMPFHVVCRNPISSCALSTARQGASVSDNNNMRNTSWLLR
jgi:hypothetical protein